MRTFKIDTNPYDDIRLYSRKEVTFEPGKMTVLVGCNGSGKSTLMMLMKDQLKFDKDILLLEWDDRMDGGSNLMSYFGAFGHTDNLISMMTSSEGERIRTGVGYFISSFRRRIRDKNPKEVWIFMDAVGSGLSIDGIIEIKNLVDIIVEDNRGIDVYMVISTNEYEFAENADCIDVTTFKHRTFKSYNAYKNYILMTSRRKEKRDERVREKNDY